MSDPELEEIVSLLEDLQNEDYVEPVGPVPSNFSVLLSMPKPSQVTLRHCSPADPDRRIQVVERNLRRKFEAAWTKVSNKAYVADIFIIGQYGTAATRHLNAFKQHLKTVETSGHLVGGEKAVSHTFHGTHRFCTVGEDSHKTRLCDKPQCFLCLIMKGSFKKELAGRIGRHKFGNGIYTSTDPLKSDGYSKNDLPGLHRKAMLLCSTVTGHKELVRKIEQDKPGPRDGCDSVEAVVDGKRIFYPETIVYQNEAIMPHALIIYDFVPQAKPKLGHTIKDGDIITMTNKMAARTLSLGASHLNHRIIGTIARGSFAQQWVFHLHTGDGWIIQSRSDNTKYLGIPAGTSTAKRILCHGVSRKDAGVFEIKADVGGTFNICLVHMLDKCVYLSREDATSGDVPAKIWIYDRVDGFENQRWFFTRIPAIAPATAPPQTSSHAGPTQTPVRGGVYLITNDRFDTALEVNESTHSIHTKAKTNRRNQHWVFTDAGGGWHIHSQANGMYLGLHNMASRHKGNQLHAVSAPGIVWDIQVAMHGTVRIAPHDSPRTVNLDANIHHPDQVTIWSHTPHTKQQRWYLYSTS